MAEVAGSSTERGYITEEVHGEMAVIRKGDEYRLRLQSGTRQVEVEITEQQAGDLRFLWL
jgi:hypothetical protein